MPKVFVANEPTVSPSSGSAYDISPAARFGKIVFVFTAFMGAPSRDPEQAIAHAARVMRDMTADDYFVAAGGDPAGVAIAAAVADRMTGGRFTYLRWDRERRDSGRKGGSYVPVDFDFDTHAPIEDE